MKQKYETPVLPTVRSVAAIADELGYTNRQMAAAAGVSPRTYQRWFDGTRNVSRSAWRALTLTLENERLRRKLARKEG